MNTVKYLAFVEAVRCGNLTAAAESLNYTQPGISHMINNLEKEYGFPLLYRNRNGVTPTENGKLIYDLFVQILALEEELQNTIQQINGVMNGKIRIGGFLSVLTQWMPTVVEKFAEQYPQVEVELFEGEMDEQIAMLKDNRIDVGIFAAPAPAGFLFIPMQKDELVVMLPKGHPLCQKPSISAADLVRYPLLMQHESAAGDLHLIYGSSHLPVGSKYTIKSDSAIAALVEKGLGVGIISSLLASSLSADVEIRPFQKSYSRTLGLVIPQNKGSLPVIHCFVKLMKELYQQIQEQDA